MKILLPVVASLLFCVPLFAQDEYELVPAAPPPPAKKSVTAGSTLRARVFYEVTGRPVRRTNVMLIAKESLPLPISGVTDASGNLVMKNVKAGKYYVIVNAPGAVTLLSYGNMRLNEKDNLENLFDGFPPIVVDGVSDVETTIPVRLGGAISGRVSYADGDPAIGVKVDVLRKVDEGYTPVISNFSQIASALFGGAGTFKTDDRGIYRFAGLPPGEYVVKVTESVVHPTNKGTGGENPFDMSMFGSMFGGGSSLVSIFFENATDSESARRLKIEQSEELPEINIIIPDRRLHKLGGKLVAAKDKLPIRNARISVSLNGDAVGLFDSIPGLSGHVTYTDEQGNWQFVDLPKGKYSIVAVPVSSEFDEAAKAYGGGEPDNDASDDVIAAAMNAVVRAANTAQKKPEKPAAPKFAKRSVEFSIEDKDLTEEVIELNHGAIISGTVVVEGDKDLPDRVTITAADESGDVSRSGSVSNYNYADDEDEEAESAKRPKPNDFSIDAISAGLTFISVESSDKKYYVKSVIADGLDLLKNPVQLKEGGRLVNVKVVLSRESGSVEASVLDEDKKPVKGLGILFVPTDPAAARNSTFHFMQWSDEEGIVKAALPPFEFAALIVPKGVERKKGKSLRNWIAEAVKKAETFKVDTGKTTKITIKRSSEKPKE